MTDVLSRYNTATQAYSSSVGSANEFQKSYNQEFYNNFAQDSIPFMSDFSIQAVPDLDENGNPNICYKNATALST